MKKQLLWFACTFCVFSYSHNLSCQTTQSGIYDAIALLNAKHGISALLIPAPNLGYDIIDPISGQVILLGQTSTPSKYVGNDGNSTNVLYAILRRNANLSATASPDEIRKAYAKNPFLKDVLNPSATRNISDKNELPDNVQSAPSSKLSGSAGLLGNIVNGTADFLIKRGSEELSISVFEKMQAFIANYPEFKTLFPHTVALIGPVAPYDYANTLKALKDAIQEDLNHFMNRIPDLYVIPKYQVFNKEIPSLSLVFSSSTLIADIHGKDGIGRALHDLGSQPYLAEQNNYSSFVKLVCLVSNSLREKRLPEMEDGEYGYINADVLAAVTNSNPLLKEELAKYYLGLLYQQCGTLQISSGTSQILVSELLNPLADKASNALDLIMSSTIQLQALNATLAKMKDDETNANQFSATSILKAGRFPLYAQLVSSALELVSPFIQESNVNPEFKKELKAIQTYWKPFSTDAINMVQAFEQKQYNLGIQNLENLLETTTEYLKVVEDDKSATKLLKVGLAKPITDSLTKLEAIITKVNGELSALPKPSTSNSALIVSNLKAQKQRLDSYLKMILAQKAQLEWQNNHSDKALFKMSEVLSYINLLVSISQAQTSAQVEALLESLALPSGSSRIKKVTNFNISVNAYVGGFFGRSTAGSTGFTNEYGLTAPIGFAGSYGFGKGGCLSVFAGVFDIGGVITYKLNNAGAYEQNVTLDGIVSPSLHLVYGFPFYLPLSVGVGCQWLTPSTATTNNINLAPHFNAFIGVDIPLLNLKAGKKKVGY